jgi:hypothetical protein
MMAKPTSNDPWEVFKYEADQFIAMCNLLQPGNRDYAALLLPVQNAVVESALLHTRQLADILLSLDPHTDAIKLKDVYSAPSEPTRLDELRTAYSDWNTAGSPRQIINKQLAHATTSRSDSYDYTPLINKLAPLLADIIQEVRAQHAAAMPPAHAKKPSVRPHPGLSAKTSS